MAMTSDKTMTSCFARRPRNLALLAKCAVRRRIMRPRYRFLILFLVLRTFIQCSTFLPDPGNLCSSQVAARSLVKRSLREIAPSHVYMCHEVSFSHTASKKKPLIVIGTCRHLLNGACKFSAHVACSRRNRGSEAIENRSIQTIRHTWRWFPGARSRKRSPRRSAEPTRRRRTNRIASDSEHTATPMVQPIVD